MEQTVQQSNLVQLVAYFLAEIIRSRRTSIRRAAEISELMTNNISALTSETQALAWVKEIENEFEELTSFRQALHFNYNSSDIKVYEKEIKEYASGLFQKDITKSSAFLKDAAGRESNIQELCIKYPDFCEFLATYTDKADLLPQFQKAN